MEHYPAKYWAPLNNAVTQCLLCPHECKITPGKRGACGVRLNLDGELYSEIYGKTSGVAVDPIEKKPLYHFLPGSDILSFGTWGCNFHCDFCQNWQISQNADGFGDYYSPEDAAALAQKRGVKSIAYTYSEPMIWMEWLQDTARIAKRRGIKNVVVSNGFVNEAPLWDLCDVIDAANIDIKSFDDAFYRKYCKGRLEWPLKTVETMVKRGVHVEVTMLIIPALNDMPAGIEEFVAWIESVDKNIPVHFSRYFPQYKMDLPPTPAKTLQTAYDIARRRLPFVYVGNINLPDTENTRCPKCRNVIIERRGFSAVARGITEDARCASCGAALPIRLK